MSEGGEARNHETVKAIADVLARYVTGTVDVGLLDIARAITALDAVRCAQGRDTDAPERSSRPFLEGDALREAMRYPQGEDHEAEINRLRAGISFVRGLCTDRASYSVIDERLGELLDGETK